MGRRPFGFESFLLLGCRIRDILYIDTYLHTNCLNSVADRSRRWGTYIHSEVI